MLLFQLQGYVPGRTSVSGAIPTNANIRFMSLGEKLLKEQKPPGWYLNALNSDAPPLSVSFVVSSLAKMFQRSSKERENKVLYDEMKKDLRAKVEAISAYAEWLSTTEPNSKLAEKVSKDALFVSTIQNMVEGQVIDIAAKHKSWKVSAEILNAHYDSELRIYEAISKLQENVQPEGWMSKAFAWLGKFPLAKKISKLAGPGALAIGVVYEIWGDALKLGSAAYNLIDKFSHDLAAIMGPLGSIGMKIGAVAGVIWFTSYSMQKIETAIDAMRKTLKQEHDKLTDEEALFRQKKAALVANEVIYLCLVNGYSNSIEKMVPALAKLAKDGKWEEINKINDDNINRIIEGGHDVMWMARYGLTPDVPRFPGFEEKPPDSDKKDDKRENYEPSV